MSATGDQTRGLDSPGTGELAVRASGQAGPLLRVVHLLHADGLGGGPVSTACLVGHLRETLEQVVIHGGRGVLAERCEALGVPHVEIPIATKTQCLLGWVALLRQLKAADPQLIILHGQWAGVLGSLAARLLRMPTLYVVRWAAFYTDWDLRRVVRNWLCERLACRKRSACVFLSSSTRYQYLYRRLVRPEQATVIPNPIPNPSREECLRHRSVVRRREGWDDRHIHVLAVGRLHDEKRFDWLLDAWCTVSRARPDARLWIVGDGRLRQSLEARLADAALGASCRMLGDREDGPAMIAAADIVAVSSMYESFGRVAAEAMAAGVPVAAFACDGIRDLIEHDMTGLLVPVGDTGALAAAVIRLIDDPGLRARLSDRARQASQAWLPDVVTSRLLACIRDRCAAVQGASACNS